MSCKFTVCQLTRGNGSEPEFSVSEVNLRPGNGFVSDNQDDILLASGFSSTFPEPGFHLSPTLQVNQDRAACSEKELEKIARAELKRYQATTYRSYTVEQDPRLCVIGSDPEKLNTFLDTYGGMLELEPLLLFATAPDIPTPIDLIVAKEGDGFRLEYSLRSPIAEEQCSYCGKCGTACPESSIDENLYVDFSTCTFCKECEKLCEHKAIDIHAVEQKTMRIPAIMVLDGTELELPDVKNGIYKELELPKFFATQFACQVDEVIACNGSICQYSGQHDFGCARCVSACPYGAVSKSSSGIQVDSLKCEECGCCVAVCPTGAMQYLRITDETFTNYIQEVDIEAGTTVVLGSEETLQSVWWRQGNVSYDKSLFLEYSSIGTLSLYHLLYLYVNGAGRVVLLKDQDQKDLDALNVQIALAGSLLGTYCQTEAPFSLMTVAEFCTDTPKAAPYKLDTSKFLPAGSNRREKLAAILEYLSEQTGRYARVKGHKDSPFATIFCDENRCTQCFACLNNCRIQSLRAGADELSLTSQSSLCVGCGICVRVCPEKALQMVPGATLDKDYFAIRTVAETEPMVCRKCGKTFGSKKSFERVMAILKKKETVDTSHFEYCDTCRVVNLFEN